MLTAPTVAELAVFSGRAAGTYSAYANQALAMATLLLEALTGLTEWPSDPTLLKLAQFGVMELADKFYLAQPYQSQAAAPFQSESIMSYSYTKVSERAKAGKDTGVLFFDLAVKELMVKEKSEVASGAITMSEWDGLATHPVTGEVWFPGPKNIDPHDHDWGGQEYHDPGFGGAA